MLVHLLYTHCASSLYFVAITIKLSTLSSFNAHIFVLYIGKQYTAEPWQYYLFISCQMFSFHCKRSFTIYVFKEYGGRADRKKWDCDALLKHSVYIWKNNKNALLWRRIADTAVPTIFTFLCRACSRDFVARADHTI